MCVCVCVCVCERERERAREFQFLSTSVRVCWKPVLSRTITMKTEDSITQPHTYSYLHVIE